MEEGRIVSFDRREEDIAFDGLRPKTLKDYVGQEKIKENILIHLGAAKGRGESIEHMLFYGPPGLGKTTLSNIIANEMGVAIKITSGPAIERPGDLAAILTNLKEHDILFIDEIHRLNRVIEEVLYPAMEDFALDIVIGKGPSARSIRLDLPKFTLIGATTKAGQISSPLRNRFGIIERLEFYATEELKTIITRCAEILNIEISPEGAEEIARRARGTPRVANRLLRRVRDFAEVRSHGKIDKETSEKALEKLEIDRAGLDHIDRKMLITIVDKFGGRPVGIDALAAAVAEEPETIEDIYEPYLMQLGFIDRTPKGRVVTEAGYKHVGKKYHGEGAKQEKLL